MEKKNVNIKAKNVSVKTNRTRRKKHTKNAPQPPPEEEITGQQMSFGVQSGFGMPRSALQAIINESASECTPISKQAKQFTLNYLDPCGVHTDSLDAARCPDGALQTASPGFVRSVNTFEFPFQSPGLVALDGLTYSIMFIQPPLLRALAIILVNANDGEFSEDIMNLFCESWANIEKRELAFYPKFIELYEGLYWTVVDTEVLRAVIPPDVNGVSGTIDSYRFTSMGMNIMFNTPDLIDQGTLVSLRYPTNATTRSFTLEQAIIGTPMYLRSSWFSNIGTLGNYIITIGQGGIYPWPSFVGNIGDFPTPAFLSQQLYSNASRSFTVNIGDSVNYVTIGSDVLFNNVTNGNQLLLFTLPATFPPNNVSNSFQVRLYVQDGPIEEVVEELDYEVVALPPLEQADMYQQDPKCMVALAKETGGVYLPGAIAQPVFNVTHSTSYRKVLFSTKSTDLAKLLGMGGGWYDTVDQNFMISIITMKGISHAAKLLGKFNRSMELVPAAHSILGFTTMGCPSPVRSVLPACFGFTQFEPHGYIANYDGLELLFQDVMTMLDALPDDKRQPDNIIRRIGKIAQRHRPLINVAAPLLQSIMRGFKRLTTTH